MDAVEHSAPAGSFHSPILADFRHVCPSVAGLVYGVATEDMDALTFGATKVIRHLMAPSSANVSINEFDSAKAIEVCAAAIEFV